MGGSRPPGPSGVGRQPGSAAAAARPRKAPYVTLTVTKEGATAYEAGDMLVFNGPARTDGYAMSAKKFESLYEPDDA